LLKHQIPIKADRWQVQVPGFTEVDLVSHSGNSARGEFASSLNVTDIHTAWTETRAILGRSRAAVREALDEIEAALPFRLLGIDSEIGAAPGLPSGADAAGARAGFPRGFTWSEWQRSRICASGSIRFSWRGPSTASWNRLTRWRTDG
jgi:hypothetical protein